MRKPAAPNSPPVDDKGAWRVEWFQFMHQTATFSVGTCEFSELPADPTNPKSSMPRLMIVIDALKVGESTGNGTGTLAYYSGGWFRAADDTTLTT